MSIDTFLFVAAVHDLSLVELEGGKGSDKIVSIGECCHLKGFDGRVKLNSECEIKVDVLKGKGQQLFEGGFVGVLWVEARKVSNCDGAVNSKCSRFNKNFLLHKPVKE